MKRVITTVGTSIFDNYFKTKNDIKTLYLNIKDKSYTEEYENYKNQAGKIKDALSNFYRNKKNYSEDISAEIKSINKIKSHLKEELEIYLLASDTINSYLASKILEELLIENDFIVYFNEKFDVIKDLQVEDRDRFVNSGLPNLIQRIENIAVGNIEASDDVSGFTGDGYYSNIIFNISGGYKATIPYITMIAQVNGAELYYIFEDTEELITIPSMPVTLNMGLFDKYSMQFKALEEGIDNYNKWAQNNYEFVQKADACIQVVDNIAMLSPLGQILWKNYMSNHAIFFATEEVLKEIENNRTLLEKVIKFTNKEIRENKTEIKGKGKYQHYVYDDGNNDYRIFYYEKEGNVYIYEVFADEEEETKYLDSDTKSSKDYDPNIYCLIDKVTKEIKYDYFK